MKPMWVFHPYEESGKLLKVLSTVMFKLIYGVSQSIFVCRAGYKVVKR